MNNFLSFPNDPFYVNKTLTDYSRDTPPDPIFNALSQHPSWGFAQHLAPHELIHLFTAYVFALPASRKGQVQIVDKPAFRMFIDSEWKIKRIAIEVDGYVIDATLIGRTSTLENGRWTIIKNGNSGRHRNLLLRQKMLTRCLELINSNAILFDYPGVGSSSGFPSRFSMSLAYDAALQFLEKGLHAKEIISYGFSIGGGVQNELLKGRELNPDIRYVFLKDRTFTNLSAAARSHYFWPCGFLLWFAGWNLGSAATSLSLQNEIIIQRAIDGEIEHDGYMSRKSALASIGKSFYGVPQMHLEKLTCIDDIAAQVKDLLKS